jgi:hypothetical protein
MRNDDVTFGSQAACLTRPTRSQRVAAGERSTSKMLVGRDRLEAYPPVL